MRCPKCNSENVYYSKKQQIFVCEDCDATFLEEQTHTNNENASKKKVFLSYGHDNNSYIVDRIKSELEKRGYVAWIDKSAIKFGDNWRKDIFNGLVNSSSIIAFLSEHSTRNPGVCLDELKIAMCVKGANIKTVLLEPENRIKPPATIANNQWLDMSNWAEIRSKSEIDFEKWFEEKFEEIYQSLESNENIEFSGDINVLKNKLNPYLNMEKEYALLSKEFYGRQWLSESIDNWSHNSNNNILMLYGGPGSGKSAFSVNYSHYNPNVIGCFLCEWNREDSINPKQLIKTIAFKLATKIPDYRSMLLIQLKDVDSLDKLETEELFNYILSRPLSQLVDGGRENNVIFIDGIDEAEDSVNDNSLASVFVNCVNTLPHWVKFIFTSRPEYNVKKYFNAFESIDIIRDMPNGYNDIIAYLLNALKFELQNKTNKLEIVNHISELAEGTFLYAEYLVEDLKAGAIELNDLNKVPRGLNAFYALSLKRKFKNFSDYSQFRDFLEYLTISESIPEDLILMTTGYSNYDYLQILDRIGSWVRRYEEDGLILLSFAHKSIKDWLIDKEKSGDYYVDTGNGAHNLAIFCKMQIENKFQNLYNNNLRDYIVGHVTNYYLIAKDYAGLEDFMLIQDELLYPLWLSWKEFPKSWNHDKLIKYFWGLKQRDEFLIQLQKEGNTNLLLWILELVKEKISIERFDRVPLQIYIDIVHLSGKYFEAVNIIEQYLSKYSFEEINNDEFLIMLKARGMHHASFYKSAKELLGEALDLYSKVNTKYKKTIYELQLFIGAKYWMLDEWETALQWMNKSADFAKENGFPDFYRRSLRAIAMYYYHKDDYEKALSAIPIEIREKGNVKTRYDVYLLCTLANIYMCIDGEEDLALQLYNRVLQYTISNGITGWIAHAYLGIANVNFKLNNYEEAIDFANRAYNIYDDIKQEWGIIMSEALIAGCKSSLGVAPVANLCEPLIKRSSAYNFVSCVSSIKDFCDKKYKYLKLYWV